MEVILLESIEQLGRIGDIVKIADGYGRNYLLPRKKAMRATKSNIALIEEKRAILEQENIERKAQAEGIASKLVGVNITIGRQAAEDGRLYGSVSPRDIVNALHKETKIEVSHESVVIHHKFKEVGIYDVVLSLHAEVKAVIHLTIARGDAGDQSRSAS